MEKRKYEIRPPVQNTQAAKQVLAEPETKNMPEKRFSTGGITATIWKNPGKSKSGQDVEYRTISLQRSYKDKEGAWQHTGSLRVNDLPKAALVLNKAYEYLVLRDTDSTNETSSESEEEQYFEEIVM